MRWFDPERDAGRCGEPPGPDPPLRWNGNRSGGGPCGYGPARTGLRRPDRECGRVPPARRENGWWELMVADTGIGTEEQYFDRIFVAFPRLNTKERSPGTGVGLAIVKRIIDRQGGRVRVESTPGEGSTSFFTLPAARPVAPTASFRKETVFA
ncbi:MAG TPA: hypothetical protein HA263_10080 [Methanoregulaceae archaeon]|nr:hypothetical protein [Methanoregulaceae archaeon]